MAYPNTDEEEFIRQYGDNPNAPDTAPVNAVDRSAPYNATQDFLNAAEISGTAAGGVTPGVGQAGSTAATDQTNLNVAAAMERADLAGRTVQQMPTLAATAMDQFGQQRQQIEAQKTQLMAKLGMIPPSAAGFAAVVLPSQQRGRHGEPSEYDKALEQLNVLDNQSKQLLQEHHYSAVENARQAHEDLARNTHIQVSSGLAKVLNGINQINQDPNMPHGSPAARAAILGLVGGNDPDIAAARGTKSFEDLVKPYTSMHDLAAQRAQFVAAFGREPESVEVTSTGGVNLRAGSTAAKATADAELKPYGVTAQQIQNPVGAQVGKMAYTDKDGKPLASPTFTPDSSGDVVRIGGTVTKAGKTPLVPIPIATYLKHGGQLGAQDQAAQAAKIGGTIPATAAIPAPIAAPIAAATTPQSIRDQYRAGKLTREQAATQLKSSHGFE